MRDTDAWLLSSECFQLVSLLAKPIFTIICQRISADFNQRGAFVL